MRYPKTSMDRQAINSTQSHAVHLIYSAWIVAFTAPRERVHLMTSLILVLQTSTVHREMKRQRAYAELRLDILKLYF